MKSSLEETQNATTGSGFNLQKATKIPDNSQSFGAIGLKSESLRLVMSEAPFDTNCAQPNFAAKHLILRSGSSGKVHQFSVYFNCDLFDTPENGVITSGLILASVLPVLGLSNRITRGLKNLA